MAEPERGVWKDVLAHIQHNEPSLWRRWFEECTVEGLTGLVATITAPSDTQRDYLETRCADAFDHALRTVTERLVTARFTGPRPRGVASAAGLSHNHRANRAIKEDERRRGTTLELRPPVEHLPRSADQSHRNGTLALLPDYSFEHFVIGPGNRLAHAGARAVADNPGKAYNPFFVHGDVGLGKTHLLQAICLDLIERRPGFKIFYTSCEHFTSRFIENVKAGRMAEFHQQFRDVDALVIDDIHFLAKRDRTQEEFFHTFNALYQSDKQIILSSDAPPEDIPHLESRLVSRFKWGLVASVEPPTFETRVEIIKEKGRLRGLELEAGVAEFVAGREQRNIRELEGDLTSLQARALMEKVPLITLPIAREALGEKIRVADVPVTVEQIIQHVTDYFGVRTADLQSKKRARSITVPRQVGMYLARQHTRHSLEEIGGYFGGRDHTTVLHAVRKIETEAMTDASLGDSVQAIELRLGSRRVTAHVTPGRTTQAEPQPQAGADQPGRDTP